jgi:anti-sigma-K factor RskA
MNADVHALTGAYVLDAVSPDERMVFERHLGDCGACRQEVSELRETATRLGTAVAATPPPRLKANVMSQIRNVRQIPPEAPVVPLRRPGSAWALRLTSAAAAVLLLVSGVLGVLLYRTQSDTEVDPQAAAIAEIVNAGDARVVNQGDPSTGRMTAVMSLSANRAVVVSDGVPDPGPDKDIQLWMIPKGGEILSAGLFEPQDGRGWADLENIDDSASIGVTIEPKGGSKQPTTKPIFNLPIQA